MTKLPEPQDLTTISLKDAFAMNSEKTVSGYCFSSDYTPAVNPNYVMPSGLLIDLIYWHTEPNGIPLFLTGPTGCGKTSGVEQFFARLNYPVFSITAHARMEVADLVGMWTMGKGGEMKFIYGPLALAMKHGGVCIINEMDLLDPAVLAGFNGLRDGSPLIIPENEGEVIKPAKGFRLVMTGNSCGNGDESGRYQGVLMQNAAFMNGLLTVEVGYLKRDVEKQLLKRVVKDHSLMDDKMLQRLVDFAKDLRMSFAGEREPKINCVLSTRNLITFARWIERCKDVGRFAQKPAPLYALERVLLNKATEADRSAVEEAYQVHFGGDDTVDLDED